MTAPDEAAAQQEQHAETQQQADGDQVPSAVLPTCPLSLTSPGALHRCPLAPACARQQTLSDAMPRRSGPPAPPLRPPPRPAACRPTGLRPPLPPRRSSRRGMWQAAPMARSTTTSWWSRWAQRGVCPSRLLSLIRPLSCTSTPAPQPLERPASRLKTDSSPIAHAAVWLPDNRAGAGGADRAADGGARAPLPQARRLLRAPVRKGCSCGHLRCWPVRLQLCAGVLLHAAAVAHVSRRPPPHPTHPTHPHPPPPPPRCRDLTQLLDAYERGEPFYLYTGRVRPPCTA